MVHEADENNKNVESDAKKIKTTYELKATLQEFEFVKVLNESNERKTIFIQAIRKKKPSAEDLETESNNASDAVIIFEKPHFGLDEVKSFLTVANEYEIDLVNDIYNKLCIYPNKPYNSILIIHLKILFNFI